MSDLNYRKQYARKRFTALGHDPLKNINSRALDNCFEMGDGIEVVKYLMGKAKTDKILHDGIRYSGMLESWEKYASQP